LTSASAIKTEPSFGAEAAKFWLGAKSMGNFNIQKTSPAAARHQTHAVMVFSLSTRAGMLLI
jgi:hypothetical protein